MKERKKNDRKSRCWPEVIQRTTLKQDPRSRFLQLFKFTNRDMNGFSKLSSARKMKLLFGMIAKFKWLLIWSHSHIFRSARMRSVFSGGSLWQSARCLLSTYFRQCSCSVRKTFGSQNHSIPRTPRDGQNTYPCPLSPTCPNTISSYRARFWSSSYSRQSRSSVMGMTLYKRTRRLHLFFLDFITRGKIVSITINVVTGLMDRNSQGRSKFIAAGTECWNW